MGNEPLVGKVQRKRSCQSDVQQQATHETMLYDILWPRTHAHTHTHTHPPAPAHARTHTRAHAHIRTHTHTHAHTHAHTECRVTGCQHLCSNLMKIPLFPRRWTQPGERGV